MHDRVIDNYLFKNEEGVTETVNGKKFRNLVNTFLAPVVEQMDDRNELWFQQTVCCTTKSNASLQLLQEYII